MITFYVIKLKHSDKYMPALGRGYTYLELEDFIPFSISVRLFKKEQDARQAITWWKNGQHNYLHETTPKPERKHIDFTIEKYAFVYLTEVKDEK